MADTTRQQRRKLIREQAKLGNHFLQYGLPRQPRREEVLGVARVVAGKLGERDNPHRASEAAVIAHTLFEQSVAARPPDPRIACRDGCSHCCHQFVGVVAPEVFRLAAAVRASRRPELAPDAVMARGKPLVGVAPADRAGRRLACPLLVDDRCGVFAERPLVCRQTTSFDVAVCIEELEGRNMKKPIEVSPAHLDHAGSASVVLLGAMLSSGLPTDVFELAAALERALADPAAEQRWLAGEDVFAGLPRSLRRSESMDFVAARIAEALAQ